DRVSETVSRFGLPDERQRRLERRPLVVMDRLLAELVDGNARKLPEALVVVVVERGPDDAALWQQAGAREVEQPGKGLAARQIARGAEEHDDVWLQRRQERRADVARVGVSQGRTLLSWSL